MTDAPETGEFGALLFDLGGVLLDIDFDRCMARWASRAGRTAADVASRFSFDAAYEDHERGLLGSADYFGHLRRVLSLELDDEMLLEGWNSIYVGINTEVLTVLEQVKSTIPLFAFTNSNPSHQAIWSTRFAPELEVFDAVFVSSQIGHRKPEPASFEVVASMIGLPPARILFFDDSAENVEGAQNAGMPAVHVTQPSSVRSVLSRLDEQVVTNPVAKPADP